MKASPVWTIVKFHCLNTGVYDSRNVKMSASLKPLSSDSHSTIGSRTNISNCTIGKHLKLAGNKENTNRSSPGNQNLFG